MLRKILESLYTPGLLEIILMFFYAFIIGRFISICLRETNTGSLKWYRDWLVKVSQKNKLCSLAVKPIGGCGECTNFWASIPAYLFISSFVEKHWEYVWIIYFLIIGQYLWDKGYSRVEDPP